MAYTSLVASTFAVGRAVIKNLFLTIKNNEDNLNTRLSSVEALGSKKVFWNGTVRGASSFTTGTNAARLRIEAAIDITDVVLAIGATTITSGDLEVDIIKATGAGNGPNFTTSISVFTTKPKIDFTAVSDYDDSTDHTSAVLSVTNGALVEGDWIQVNIVSKPASLGRFSFYVIGEAS